MNSETEYDIANMVYRTKFTMNVNELARSFEATGETFDEAREAMHSMRERMENEAFYGVKQPKTEPYAGDAVFGSF